MTKLTSKTALTYAIAVLSHSENKDEAKYSLEDVVVKLTAMLEALDKKSVNDRKPTEHQKENGGFREDIYEYLLEHPAQTATEILRGIPTFPVEMSNQRVSQLLRQLWLEHRVTKEVVKGKTLFSAVTVEV